MTTLVQKAVKSDMLTKCDDSCPLFAHCSIIAVHDSLEYKIAKFCSDRYRDGYRKGYMQCVRDNEKKK